MQKFYAPQQAWTNQALRLSSFDPKTVPLERFLSCLSILSLSFFFSERRSLCYSVSHYVSLCHSFSPIPLSLNPSSLMIRILKVVLT